MSIADSEDLTRLLPLWIPWDDDVVVACQDQFQSGQAVKAMVSKRDVE